MRRALASSLSAARAYAASNAFRLGPTPTPPRAIVASNWPRENGSTPVPASAPNSTALITLSDCSAASAMSKRTKRFAAARACARSAALSTRPSPSAVFSVIE
jgi:hypothetical protein